MTTTNRNYPVEMHGILLRSNETGNGAAKNTGAPFTITEGEKEAIKRADRSFQDFMRNKENGNGKNK
jgi:hypothetical protein